ncbi:hypothetical protein PTKIN_Ptkin09bG0253800 [Pterospermum kingtungense]
MEESQNFEHEHPLVLLINEEQMMMSNQSGVADCWRCGEKVSVPSFSCVECGFYLHKQCAEAPLEINHPFHPDHLLVLLRNSPYASKGHIVCDFCDKTCKRFVYHCSCDLDFHIKCAFFTYNIAQNNLKDQLLEHVAHEYLSVSPENNVEELGKPTMFFACWEPLENYTYFSPDCGFNLHKKCADLPLKINELGHEHTLSLQFNSKQLSCYVCGETQQTGFVYCCPPCNSAVHIECVPPPFVEVKCRQHAFTLFQRRAPFICDAYSCPGCKVIFHAKCVTQVKGSYFIDSLENEDEKSTDSLAFLNDKSIDPITVIERNDAGEAAKVKHFLHAHELMLRDNIAENDKCCDGCRLPISASFYYCSQCDFFLHKACSGLPKMKHVWFHNCQEPLPLALYNFFKCLECRYWSTGFCYKCSECHHLICLRCVIALSPGALTCPGHKHPLFFYKESGGLCSACGYNVRGALRCKDCDFILCHICVSLPTRAQHKCDKHLLGLTYHDDNNYSECHYCDICEEPRDPNHWFYHCATCDNSAHINCVLGRYPYIKLGKRLIKQNHPHPLTFVNKMYYYPECVKCGKPCEDLALECAESGCNYIVHWKC